MRRLLLVLAACGVDVEAEPARALAHPDRAACEAQAAELGQLCGTVWMFDVPAENPLGRLEKCIPEIYLDAAVEEFGPALPSDDERFAPYVAMGIDPPCIWSCPEVVDCNAYDSCLCPGVRP